MLNNSILYLLLSAGLAAASCNGNSAPAGDDKDTVAGQLTAADSDSMTGGLPADTTSYLAQINAPDNLFDDGSEPATWENAGFTDARDFKLFLVQFKTWVRQDSVDSIVAHTRFPLGIAKNREIFLKKYPHLFDDRMKEVVAGQRLDRIFRNEHGAMIGRGDIWFNTDKGRYVIIAIHK